MNRKTIAWTAAGLFLLSLPLAALARGPGNGGCRQGAGTQAQGGCQGGGMQQRLRDGSCGNANCPNQGSGNQQRRGNCPGPGNGAGSQGSQPQDGTGNGAPTGN